MPQQKRVVSKGEYIAHLVRKAALELGAILMGIGGQALVVVTCFCVIATIAMLCRPDTWSPGGFLFVIGLTFLSGFGAWALMRGAIETEDKSSKLEPVTPQTRQSIEQLSAEETLVRACTEPTDEQETTLLRAATGADQTPQQQLLRPSS